MSNAKLIWKVNYNDFPYRGSSFDKLKFLLSYAILAPSGHNTQPWLFSINNETVEVYTNLKKRLFVMDPVSRELYLSIGACIANLLAASRSFGIEYEISYFPRGISDELVARIEFKDVEKAEPKDEDTLRALVNRRNNREHYLPAIIDKKIQSEWYKCVPDSSFRLDLVSDNSTKLKLAEATAEGLKMAFKNRSFRKELADWLRNNYVYCEDGIPINTTDMPVPSLIAASLVRLLDIGPVKAKNDKKKMIESPLIAVVSTREDGPLQWVRSGEVFENVQISASKNGIASAVLVAAVEEGELYKKIQQALNTNFRPQIVFRLGYAEKQSIHAPRVPVEKLLIDNEIFQSPS